MVEGDQVWFVIDTDAWGEAIPELKSLCRSRPGWFVAESNPCFEVWLYYHVFSEAAWTIPLQGCSEWKNLVNARFPGGFDSRKHPVLIGDAIQNASVYFRAIGDEVLYGSTEVFKLSKAMYPLIAAVVESVRRYLGDGAKRYSAFLPASVYFASSLRLHGKQFCFRKRDENHFLSNRCWCLGSFNFIT